MSHEDKPTGKKRSITIPLPSGINLTTILVVSSIVLVFVVGILWQKVQTL